MIDLIILTFLITVIGLIAIYSLLIIGFNMPELQSFLQEREIPVPKEAEPRERSKFKIGNLTEGSYH